MILDQDTNFVYFSELLWKNTPGGKEIIPVSCPQIVKKGGALNCISWNIKKELPYEA